MTKVDCSSLDAQQANEFTMNHNSEQEELYSHRELTLAHKFDGDIIVVSTCVKPAGEMMYSSSRDSEKIIPHKVAKQLPPTKPYGASYYEELLGSEWSCFFPKHK